VNSLTNGKERKTGECAWDGEQIRALRKHLGLTQSEMAERLGKQQQGISEWERGITRPRGSSTKLLSIIARQTKFGY